MKEWIPYGFDLPKAGGHLPFSCSRLTEVYHVAHIPAAHRILEDGCIKAGLIYDKSRLNRTRMSVAWTSANTWHQGSIYGTVQFSFKWKDLIEDKRIYWVEVMQDYKPHAYRLLITDRNLSSSRSRIPARQFYRPNLEEALIPPYSAGRARPLCAWSR